MDESRAPNSLKINFPKSDAYKYLSVDKYFSAFDVPIKVHTRAIEINGEEARVIITIPGTSTIVESVKTREILPYIESSDFVLMDSKLFYVDRIDISVTDEAEEGQASIECLEVPGNTSPAPYIDAELKSVAAQNYPMKDAVKYLKRGTRLSTLNWTGIVSERTFRQLADSTFEVVAMFQNGDIKKGILLESEIGDYLEKGDYYIDNRSPKETYIIGERILLGNDTTFQRKSVLKYIATEAIP